MDAYLRLFGSGITLPLIPLVVAGLGDLICERSGVLNMCVEGFMIVGAFFGIICIRLFSEVLSVPVLLAVCMLVATLVGALFSLLHAFSAVNLKAEQNISSTAINTLAPAFCMLLSKAVFGTDNFSFPSLFIIPKIPVLGDIPIIGPLFFQGCYATTFIAIFIYIAVNFMLYKTKFGLQLRSCGENPQAADSVGIDVYKMRYIAVVLSGALSGLGGFIYIMSTTTNYYASVYGFGYLALSVVSFGQFKPKGIILAALLFSSIRVLSSTYAIIPFIYNLGIPAVVYKILPYLMTMVVVSVSKDKHNAPAICGEPYDKGKR